jgi:hypothetical protein
MGTGACIALSKDKKAVALAGNVDAADIRVAGSVALSATEVNATILRGQEESGKWKVFHNTKVILLSLKPVCSWFCLLTVSDRPGRRGRGKVNRGRAVRWPSTPLPSLPPCLPR